VGEMIQRDTLLIELSFDGDQFCALIGANIQEGVAGFGDSPIDALENLCHELHDTPYNLNNCTLG